MPQPPRRPLNYEPPPSDPTRPAPPMPTAPRRSRVRTQSRPPSDDGCQYDGSGEVPGEFIVTSGDSAPVFEETKGPFDHIASAVGFGIERVPPLARRVLFDFGRGAAIDEEPPKLIAVVSRVPQHGFGGWQWRHEPRSGRQVVTISLGQAERDNPPAAIHDGVDLGGSPTSAAADGLFLSPPFPPAAQR